MGRDPLSPAPQRRRRLWPALALALAGLTAGVPARLRADDAACAASPALVGPCRSVRGRLSFWNGAPSARIWPVGSTRLLGVHDDRLPPALKAQVAGFDTELWATYVVCPLTRRRPGHMQFVCIAAWHDLRVRQRQSP